MSRIFKFELTEEALRIISNALASQPYHAVVATIGELQRQVNEQSRPQPIRDENAG